MAKLTKTFPRNFSSYEEYDAYVHCLSKAKVGDEVDAYFSRDMRGNYSPSPTKTDFTFRFPVIGIKHEGGSSKFARVILLGTNTAGMGFWVINGSGAYRMLLPGHLLHKFEFAYWHYSRDLKIKRLYIR